MKQKEESREMPENLELDKKGLDSRGLDSLLTAAKRQKNLELSYILSDLDWPQYMVTATPKDIQNQKLKAYW